ncbi:Gata transcription factor [Thalictrum thalictroides]|uniref:Protein FAR1-RELATED SEQUENCE n=1 Tax=Thalictrum thalictroides TaxID=46969 RepID=A0A7J6V046_THATH|nr:Gata transcription factor [Thalictrum thalictroides]
MASTDGDGLVRTTGSDNWQPPASVIQIDGNNGRNDIVGVSRDAKEKEKDVEEVRLKSKRHRDHNVASKSRSSEQERPSNHSVATNNGTSELTLSFEGKVFVFNGVALEKVQAVLSYLGGNVTAITVPVNDQYIHQNTMAMVSIPQHLNLSRRIASVIRFREKRKERGFDNRTRYTTQKDVSQRMDSKHKGCTLELNDAVQKDGDPPSAVNCNIDMKVPKLGMVFQSDDQAYDYYNRYARSVGFSIRRSSTTHRADRTVSKRTFCCSQEGKYRSHSRGPPKKQRSNTRTDCKACFAIKIQGDGNYSLVEFVEEHNHELVPPSEVHILRSHRKSVGNEYRNTQLGGLTTIQRSEDVDDYLKRYFKRHMPIQDILTQYEKALSYRRGKERDEDFISRRTKPNLRTTWPVEVRVAERYTANLFALFQEEYVHTLDVFVDAADEDGRVCIYKVSSFENIKPHTVTWTKDARDGVVVEYHEKSPKVDFFSSFTLLYTDLAYIAVTIAVKGASTESSCTFTKGLLIRVLEELDHFLKSDSDQTKALEDAVLTLRDRPLKKPKGKVSSTNKGTPEKGKRNGKIQSRPTAAATASVPSMTSDISNIPIPSVRPWSMSYTEESYRQVEQELLPHSGIDGTQFGLLSGGWNVQHAWEGVVAPQNEIGYPQESGLEALSLGPISHSDL